MAGREPEWTGVGLERDATVAIEQVHAIGPAGVVPLGSIRDAIHQCGEPQAQLSHTGGCGRGALVIGARGGKQHVVLDIGADLPQIGGVSLLNVDDVERDAILVSIIKAIELGNLPAKGRSSIAAEDQGDGALAILI